MIARQEKIEKRTQRTGEVSKSVNNSLRHAMARSEKKRKAKKKIVVQKLTQEEIDYLRYVDN